MAHVQEVETEEPELLTIDELAKVLRRSKASIYADLAAGKFPIPHVRFGAQRRWSRIRVNEFLHGA